jgi:hypothetical protein
VSINTTSLLIEWVDHLSESKVLWDLKEKAKWSHDTEECKMAISELSRYGGKAIPSLEEVLSVSAYEAVKAACIEAIKAAKEKEAASQASKIPEKEASSDKRELNLADLPP